MASNQNSNASMTSAQGPTKRVFIAPMYQPDPSWTFQFGSFSGDVQYPSPFVTITQHLAAPTAAPAVALQATPSLPQAITASADASMVEAPAAKPASRGRRPNVIIPTEATYRTKEAAIPQRRSVFTRLTTSDAVPTRQETPSKRASVFDRLSYPEDARKKKVVLAGDGSMKIHVAPTHETRSVGGSFASLSEEQMEEDPFQVTPQGTARDVLRFTPFSPVEHPTRKRRAPMAPKEDSPVTVKTPTGLRRSVNPGAMLR